MTTVPSVQDLTTFAGIMVVVLAGMRLARPFLWSQGGDQERKWSAFFAVGLGMVVSIVGVFVLDITIRQDVAQAILNGVFAGLAASGLYDAGGAGQKVTR